MTRIVARRQNLALLEMIEQYNFCELRFTTESLTYFIVGATRPHPHSRSVMESYATAKGQIVIPASLPRKFGIKKGTRIEIQADERTQSIVLKPITRDYIHSLRSKHKGKGLLKSLVAKKKVEREL